MGYASLKECLHDLERAGHVRRIEAEVDPELEAAAIHRRVFAAGGPALFFARLRGTPFPAVSNLFGTMERARFMFRDTLESVRRVLELKIDPGALLKRPLRYAGVPFTLLKTLPRKVAGGPVFAHQARVGELPQLRCWPRDGGAFVTLPQVYTEDPERPGWQRSNLGMYRIQLSGGAYAPDKEVGLHYQIHRGIGVHHAAALRKGEALKVNVFVGGPPALTLAAVMPLPEGISELAFAGALGGRRVRMAAQKEPGSLPIHVDADFCLVGTVVPGETRPEGPFGDHLGYYSLAHDFPVLHVHRVYHRGDAVWPFTVVGRPPQEDTAFGALIHELTGPVIPAVLPGVQAVHAVDATGVHPLLLAVGSERYVPYEEATRPRELLTQANAILGQGQLSLAKYLLIAAAGDAPPPIHDIPAFFGHVLARFDPARDLHFQTETNIDTLDYSGGALNQGSKLVIAAVGKPRRALPADVPAELRLPEGFSEPRVALPGVLVVKAPPFAAATSPGAPAADLARLCAAFRAADAISRFPLVVLVDDSEFAARTTSNFLWVTFTRSNPAVDVGGVEAFVAHKHWGCRGSVVIDARRKLHHAPPLEEDPAVERRVDALFARGGPLHGIA